MTNSVKNEEEEGTVCTVYIDRDHTWAKAALMAFGLSMCITVDILQYSMPLAFLPSVLEDRGHSTMKIASAIGVYYWTGFVFQVVLTSYQIWKLVKGKGHDDQGSSLEACSRQIKYLIVGLGIGAATLIWQATSPRWHVHLLCRAIQGAAGAVIFFYTILLSASMFKDGQKTFAMCASTIALNVAEVLGATLGAVIFHHHGQRTVFWFLGIASIVKQIVLVGVLCLLKGTQKPPSPLPASRLPSNAERRPPEGANGWNKLRESCRNEWLQIAVILIFVAASVKGSVEEMLPFYADHQWGYDPLMIGKLFATIAVSYIIAAAVCGNIWESIHDWAVGFSATCLGMLGVTAYTVFYIAALPQSEATRTMLLWVFLAIFGMFLGFTHTPAALLLGDVIENESEASKGVVNGIWNTMWEFGGSVGFFAGGAFAHNYENKLFLLSVYVVVCFGAMFSMCALSHFKRTNILNGTEKEKQPLLNHKLEEAL